MQTGIYRAKRKDNGEWIEGYLYVLAEGTPYAETYILKSLDEHETIYDVWKEAYEVIPETVGRFTSKYDKNRKKVFEGDIVRAMMDYGPAGMLESTATICWDVDYGWQWNYFDVSTIEVIGNIHDDRK